MSGGYRFVNGVLACAVVVGLLAACGAEEGWYYPEPPPSPTEPSIPDPMELPSALQSVVSSITLPQHGTDHGADLDGDGVVDNQVGRLLGELEGLLGMRFQHAIDEELKAGKALVLYDLLANSLVNDGQVELRAYVGKDLDTDPSDNFSGAETFAIERGLDQAVLPASIVASRLETQPRRAFVSLPFRTATSVLPLVMTQVHATVGPNGMQQGILAGAIPVAEAIDRLGPVLATELDRVYNKPDVAPMTFKALQNLVDSNGDGSITQDEFKTSNAFGFLLHTADIDVSGDGKPDSISFGIAFQSVPCHLSPVSQGPQ